MVSQIPSLSSFTLVRGPFIPLQLLTWWFAQVDMTSAAYRRADDITATRARHIVCRVNVVIDRRRTRLRIWRTVSLVREKTSH